MWSAIAAGGGAFGLLLGGVLTDAAELGVDLLRQRADRDRDARRSRSATCPSRAAPQRQATARPRRRDLGHRRARRARVRDRQGARTSAGARRERSASPRSRSRCSAAFVLIEQRSPAPLIRLGIFRVRSLAGRQHGPAARRRRPVRVLLLLVALRPADPRLLAARGGPRVPAGHGRDRRRRGLAQQLVKRIGVRTTAVVGMVIAAVRPLACSGRRSTAPTSSDVLPAMIPQSIGMGLFFVPITLIATTERRRGGRRASRRGCSTPRSRSAARSASPCSRRSRPTSRRACSPHARPAAARREQRTRCSTASRSRSLAAAVLVAFGAVLLLVARAQAGRARDRPRRSAAPGRLSSRAICKKSCTGQDFALVQRRRRIAGAAEPAERGNQCGRQGRGGESPRSIAA